MLTRKALSQTECVNELNNSRSTNDTPNVHVVTFEGYSISLSHVLRNRFMFVVGSRVASGRDSEEDTIAHLVLRPVKYKEKAFNNPSIDKENTDQISNYSVCNYLKGEKATQA